MGNLMFLVLSFITVAPKTLISILWIVSHKITFEMDRLVSGKGTDL